MASEGDKTDPRGAILPRANRSQPCTTNHRLVHTKDSPRSRILVADDHPLFRAALRQMLNGCLGLDVIGEAEDGKDAIELCRRLGPDLVLMDVGMPEMDGLE